jgi:hypothetical protein
MLENGREVVEMHNLTDEILVAFRVSMGCLNVNNAKIVELMGKIERAIVDCTEDVCDRKTESYKALITLLNEQNKLLMIDQKSLLDFLKRDQVESKEGLSL